MGGADVASDLASLRSLLSGVGVLVSLTYLSLQIRRNTRAVRAQIHQHITDGGFSMGSIVTANARVFTAGISSNADSFAAMSDADKYAFMSSIFVFFKHFENMYLQYKEGLIAPENWNAWTLMMFMYWRMPGVQLWWKSRRESFAPGFRRFIEESAESSMPKTTDFFAHLGGKNGPAHA
jgi:hypothetical protein